MIKPIIVIVCAAIIAVAVVFIVFGRTSPTAPDNVFINDAVQAALQSGSDYESVSILNARLSEAFADMDAVRADRDNFLMISLYIAIIILALFGISLCVYFERNFLTPFRKLQSFAHRIAAGNLDISLEMDKRNIFGAFTESFDLMRDELRTSRENEYNANRSKKELVASLSHDIKTPVASVMSAMDIMLLRAKDEKERKTIHSVIAKLEKIDALVTNMFHSTLEELQALKVTPKETESSAIAEIIMSADYKERVKPFEIPDCLVLADAVRLQQMMDNIISNSYKYADTEIFVSACIDGQYLVVSIEDSGSGVAEEELPLIFGKYYRGKNAATSDGYGLGLYISNYIATQMGGSIFGENKNGSFAMVVNIRLAGICPQPHLRSKI